MHGYVCASGHQCSIEAIEVEGQGQISSDLCLQGNYTLVDKAGDRKKKVKQMLQ